MRFLQVVLLAGPLFSVGCGEENPVTSPITNFDPGPENTTSERAMERFVWAYNTQNADALEGLFTGDFVFEFSENANPELVAEYPEGWTKADEMITTHNLFQGGVNSDSMAVEGASRVKLILQFTQPAPDTSQGRDPAVYRTLLTAIRMEIDIGEDTKVVGDGVDLTRHRWDLVRGDVAVGLDSTQAPDASRWYIHHWQDRAPGLRDPSPIGQNLRSHAEHTEAMNVDQTWGAIKADYR